MLERCVNPDDVTRMEIEHAIAQGRNVVPLFFEGFKFSAATDQYLSPAMKALPNYNGSNIHDDFFDAGMERLRTQFLSRPLQIVLQPVSAQAQAAAPDAPEFVIARTGAADFRSINDALANVPEGAILRVRPGVYREAVRITKAVEIIGDGARDDILLESDAGHVIEMATDYAIVRGLTMRQRADESKKLVGVYIPTGRLTLEDCDISSSSDSCIYICNRGTEPLVRSCTIHDGVTTGIRVEMKARAAFHHCEIYGNTMAGILSNSGSRPTLQKCSIFDNKQGGGIIYQNGGGVFEGCDIVRNGLTGFSIRHPGGDGSCCVCLRFKT